MWHALSELMAAAEQWTSDHPWMSSLGYAGIVGLALVLYAMLGAHEGPWVILWIVPLAVLSGFLTGLARRWNTRRATTPKQ